LIEYDLHPHPEDVEQSGRRFAGALWAALVWLLEVLYLQRDEGQ